MSDNLVVIAKYGTPEEAHLLRNHLEAAGIPVFLEGESMAGLAWHFANALGGVKVLVPEEYAFAAEELLGDADALVPGPTGAEASAEPEPHGWICPHCGEEVDEGMDVCWACGRTVEGARLARPDEEAEAEPEPRQRGPWPAEVAMFIVLFPPTLAFFLFTKLCALLAPLVPDVRHREAAEAAGQPAEADQPQLDGLVRRAWRAAVFGLFMLPPLVMTLYSVWLLAEYASRRRDRNRRRDRRALWALGVNALAAACLGLLVAWTAASLWQTRPSAPRQMGPVPAQQAPWPGPSPSGVPR